MPQPSNVTKFPGGISDFFDITDPHSNIGQLDPLKYVVSYTDFCSDSEGIATAASGLAAAQAGGPWTATVVEAGAGNASLDYLDELGGAIRITNDAADNDGVFFQHKSEAFRWSDNRRMLIRCRFRLSNVTQSDFIFGLSITDTTPLDSSDAIVFQKDDDSTTLNFVSRKASAAFTYPVFTLVDATYYLVVATYNGIPDVDTLGNTVYPFAIAVNGTNIGSALVPAANIGNTQTLALTFGVQNGDANARQLDIDNWWVAVSRGVG